MNAINSKQTTSIAQLIQVDLERLKANGGALLLLGPTALGKSRLAIRIANETASEIISVDSCAIYTGLDIGTAKPAYAERRCITHHLIDICAPSERFSVGAFFEKVNTLIPDILQRGKLPILVGGTMMYVNALLCGISSIPQITQIARRQAQALLDEQGSVSAHLMLRQLDTVSYRQIAPTDRQRLVRAWEVLISTGQPISHWWSQGRKSLSSDLCLRFVMPPKRDEYRQNLNERFEAMLDAGLAAELEQLVATHGSNVPAFNAVGYRQLLPYVLGELEQKLAITAAKQATWQLARRQMTWIRKFDPNIQQQVMFNALQI